MTDQSPEQARIRKQLGNLTRRQCQILYWVCHGEEYEEIGKRLGYSYQLIQKEMTRVYRLLDLAGHSRAQKRYMLTSQICPIHETMVSDPEKDCQDRVIDAFETEPDPEVLEEVKEDEQRGLIPLKGLVHISQPEPSQPPKQKGRSTIMVPVPPSNARQNPLPWILVGVLATLLCVAAAAIVILITREPSTIAQNPPTTGPIAPTQATQAAPATTFLMPTSPVPTTTAQVVVATRVPIVVTPTVSPEEQDPAPGSIIAAGQGYTKNGVTLTLKNQIDLRSYYLGTPLFGFQMIIENRSGRQLIVLWKNASVHAKDDKGRSYERGAALGEENWRRDKQFTLDNGKSKIMQMNSSAMGDNDDDFAPFIGPIDSSAKYLIFTIDQMAGLSNLNWKYDLP